MTQAPHFRVRLNHRPRCSDCLTLSLHAFFFRHQATQTLCESRKSTHVIRPDSFLLSLVLSRSYKVLKLLPHAVCLKRKVIKCIRQECGLREDLSANTQKANVQSSAPTIDCVEVIEAFSAMRSVPAINFIRVEANPYLLTSEHEFVDSISDLRRKAKEW